MKRKILNGLRKRAFSLAMASIMTLALTSTGDLVTYAGQDTDKFEPIEIDPESLNGNTILGQNDKLQGMAGLDGWACFFSNDNSNYNSEGGIPANGKLTEDGVPYDLAVGGGSGRAYDGNDSIRLTNDEKSHTLDLDVIGAYQQIYVLGTAGGPGDGNYANFSVKLNYTDGTHSETIYKLYDWYDGTHVDGVYKDPQFKRVVINSGTVDGTTNGGPYIQSATISADASKLLKSISFEMKSKNADESCEGLYCGIYAITGKVSDDVPARPVLKDATNVKETSFVAKWNATKGATSYRLDIASDKSFKNILDDYNNKEVTATKAEVTGLTKDETYYIRVRAVNESGQSLSSNRKSVTTGIDKVKNNIDISSKFSLAANKNVKVTWGKVDDADGYEIYMGYCGNGVAKLVKTVKASANSLTIKKLDGKSIDQKKHVKGYVTAYKIVNEKKVQIAKTITGHAVGKKNKTVTDAKYVKVTKASYSLAKGNTTKIKAKTVKANSKLKLLSKSHTPEFRYATSNDDVATVSSSGKIKAIDKGTCYVYVYAVNGLAKRVKVTVK